MRWRMTATTLLLVAAAATPAPATPAPGVVVSECERTQFGYRCTAGPIDVPAGEMVEFMTGVAAPSQAGYITSARATLVDGRGKPIAHHMVHLHHAVWLNPMREDMTCESYDGGFPNYERFFASGKERTKLALPPGYGYYWNNGIAQGWTQSAPWWALVAHLDGMHGNDDTYIRLDMDFTPLDEAGRITEIRPVWLDVRNCSSEPEYDVAKGEGANGVAKETWSYRMPQGGRFVFLGGHLHDGGLRLTLRNVTRDRALFTSVASYDLAGEPSYLTGMSRFVGKPGKSVGRGDRLRLTSVYDSTRARQAVMGIMVGALAVD